MSWFEKLMPSRIRVDSNKTKKVIPEGVWEKCPSCQTVLYREDIVSNQYVCTNCGYHMRIRARDRYFQIQMTKNVFKLSSKMQNLKIAKNIRIELVLRKKLLTKRCLLLWGKINGIKIVAAFEFSFGDQWAVVGEKFTR